MLVIFEKNKINECTCKYIDIETILKNMPAVEHAGKYDNDGRGFSSTLGINTNTGFLQNQ